MDTYHVVDGVRIAVSEHPQNAPVLLIALPGITEPKESIEAFAKGIIEHLEEDIDLVAADLYAQGSSDGEWDLHAMVRGFGELIDRYAKRYDAIVLLGHSAGGIIAANASIGRTITGIVIINSPARPQEAIPEWILENTHAIPKSLLETAVRTYDLYERITNEEYRAQANEGTEHPIVVGMRIDDPNRFLEHLKEAPGLIDAAEQVSAPTLFVYGGNQPRFGVRDDRLSASIETVLERWQARADLSIIPGADHNLNERTRAGKRFNVDERYLWVRKDIARWINARRAWF
jgi:pimeloyl-ACP methyl ester carboxylesterase